MDNQERVYKGTSRPIRKGEIVNEVYKTDDYSIFKLSKFNRNVLFRKEMLEQAKQGIISPIVVNEQMIVIDGQNRLLHSKKAGVPVEYIIKPGLDEKDIVRMNTVQKPWSLKNYIEAFANQGKPEYVKLVDLINKKYSNVTNTILFASDVTNGYEKIYRQVREGDFKFHNYEKTVEFLLYSKRFREETKTPKRSKVETALYELFRLKGFNENRLIKKVLYKNIDEEIRVKSHNHTSALQILLDAYNDRIKPESSNYINYHITSSGSLIIERDRQEWTKEKSGNADE